jgi:insulysin
LVSVKTIMSFHAVEISFPLEYQPPYYNSKPGSFLGHFVGHEGPGSLHSYLKNKGWVTGLSSGPQSLGRGFAMFKVTLYLTKDGFGMSRPLLHPRVYMILMALFDVNIRKPSVGDPSCV